MATQDLITLHACPPFTRRLGRNAPPRARPSARLSEEGRAGHPGHAELTARVLRQARRAAPRHGATRIQAVDPGSFAAWMKARGRLGGRHKVPRIVNEAALFRSLRGFMRAP